jgi:hypothetical protein
LVSETASASSRDRSLAFSAGGEVSVQHHGDRRARHLGQPGGPNDAGRGNGPSQARGQRERCRDLVRHPNHDIPDQVAGGDVLLNMLGLRHRAGVLPAHLDCRVHAEYIRTGEYG